MNDSTVSCYFLLRLVQKSIYTSSLLVHVSAVCVIADEDIIEGEM